MCGKGGTVPQGKVTHQVGQTTQETESNHSSLRNETHTNGQIHQHIATPAATTTTRTGIATATRTVTSNTSQRRAV